MNPLDVEGELKVGTSGGLTTARIPLNEPGDWMDWMNLYPALARSEGLDAQVAPEPGGAVLTVTVSSDASREQTFHLLDAAVDLIERAKADANGQRDASLSVAESVKEWWSAQGRSTA